MADNFSVPQPGMQTRLGPGSRIASYVIEKQVGAGGMAVVFRARDEALGRLAAVKVLSPALSASHEFRSRFERERRLLALVDESHILPVYAAGEADGVLYIATRFVSGGDLAGLLRTGGPLDPERTASLITQVAAALDAVHAVGLLHRDVKPANVLIDIVPGRPEHAYLSDFGLSRAASSATGLTAPGVFMGTPDYCPPEQITGTPPVSGRSDQYALACVAFSLLTGAVPYPREESIATLFAHVKEPAPAATALRPELTAAVDAVLARAMAKDPAERYPSCGEFAGALRDAVRLPAAPPAPPAPETVPVLPSAAAEPMTVPPPPARSRRTAIVVGAIMGVVILTGGITTAVVLSGGSSGTTTTFCKGTATPAAGAVALPVPSGDCIYGVTAFSQDGTLVAGEGGNNSDAFYVWNAVTDKYVTTLTSSALVGDYALAFSPDDKTLTAADVDGDIYQWDLATGNGSPLYDLSGSVNAKGALTNVALSGDGRTLAVTDNAGDGVDIINVRTGAITADLTDPGSAPVFGVNAPSSQTPGTAVSLSDDGSFLTVGDSRGNLYVLNVRARQVIATLRYNPAAAGANSNAAATISGDGKLVVIPDGPRGQPRYSLWDVATQANVTPHDARWPGANITASALFSYGGQVIATDNGAGTSAELWNATTRAHIASVAYSTTILYLYGVSPDGKEILTADLNSNPYIWAVP